MPEPLFALSPHEIDNIVASRHADGASRPASWHIRAKCRDCAGSGIEARNCGRENCALYALRPGCGSLRGKGSRGKAIRRYCLWCMCGNATEVRLCPSGPDMPLGAVQCPLWALRFGRKMNVYAKVRGDQLAKRVEALGETLAVEKKKEDVG